MAPLPLIVIGPSQSLWAPITLFNFGGASSTHWLKARESKHAAPDWKSNPREAKIYEELKQIVQLKPDYLKEDRTDRKSPLDKT